MKGGRAKNPLILRTLFIAVWAAGVACLLGSAGPGHSQIQNQRFEETAEVLEVEIPVNVAMRDGTPVRDLSAEDFEIFDNGRRQEITGLRVIDLELLEPGQTRTEMERAVPAAARRHFLFLFDLSFSSPTSIIRAREAAREFALRQLHPSDLAAVATHSIEQGARLLVTFTPDRSQIARAIDTLGAPQMLQLSRRDPLRFLIDDPGVTGFEASRDTTDLSGTGAMAGMRENLIDHIRVLAKEMVKAEKSFLRGRISSWSRSMGAMARYLDSVQGRKNVIYFSEGFDGRLLLGRQPSALDREAQEDRQNLLTGNISLVDTDDMFGNAGLLSDVGLMLEEFRRADCVIQTVDISGLRADSEPVERARRVGKDALFFIANDTGGQLYENSNNFGNELKKVLERSSVTYLLSFQPSEIASDGSYHRVTVKADLPRGARISARQGYYAPRPYGQLHPLEKSLLAADAIASATENSLIDVDLLAAPFRANAQLAYVPIIIEAQGGDLLVGQESPELAVELYAYVTDERGEMKDFISQLVSLDLEGRTEVFRQSGLKYYGHMVLGPGSYLIRVLVRNAATGRSGLRAIQLEVPKYELAQPILLPPFIVENQGQWFLVREKTEEQIQRSFVYPFTVNGEPFIPAARPAMSPDDAARVCLVAYNLGHEEPLVAGRILAEDGKVVATDVLADLERTITGIEGLDKFTAVLRPQGLEAGNYRLQVALTDPASGVTEINTIPFTLGAHYSSSR